MVAISVGTQVAVAEHPLRIRWLGRVAYEDAWALQRGLFSYSADNHLLLLEHPHVFTLGPNGDESNLLGEPDAPVIRVDRGGDVTYHGPGQVVGYPILSLLSRRTAKQTDGRSWRAGGTAGRAGGTARQGDSTAGQADAGEVAAGGMISTAAYVHSVEQLLIDVLEELGMGDVGRLERYRGVWVRPDSERPAKIAAVGVRLSRGRTMHGFALNVSTDLSWFKKIVPCGIKDFSVTSLEAEGLDATTSEVAERIAARAGALWGKAGWDYSKAASGRDIGEGGSKGYSGIVARGIAGDNSKDYGDIVVRGADGDSRNASGRDGIVKSFAGSSGETPVPLSIRERKPSWLRAQLADSLGNGKENGGGYWRIKQVMSSLELTTVCEEAGCPNISECWNAGTATFMINGDSCTRDCGFCLVDTRKPLAADPDEPARLAHAVRKMGLDYAVITAVARDDLPDGGAEQFVRCIAELRRTCPDVAVEVLIPDFKGKPEPLEAVFAEQPEVLNHNLETVLRLQRMVRPQASYARSLAVLARAKDAGLTTKSSIMVGLGETEDEVLEALADLVAVGTDIVTLGQYLRPSAQHLPIARWWHPDEFAKLAEAGEEMGIRHVEAGPLVRSSYHASQIC